MNALSLFSGIGGIDLACEWAGIKTVAFCEREPFCQKVLRKHWPDIPIYDDVCTLTKKRMDADGIGTVELVHGGFPCQPFSATGKKAGRKDDRDLWPEMFRIIRELQPAWVVGENVANFANMELERTLTDLESEGYETQTFLIPACGVNAKHQRYRTFIVAHTNGIKKWAWDGFQQSEGDTTGERTGYSGAMESLGAVATITEQTRTETAATWTDEPCVARMAHGIPNRLDRLAALGNAVVPQQIYPILAAIKQIDDMMRGLTLRFDRTAQADKGGLNHE